MAGWRSGNACASGDNIFIIASQLHEVIGSIPVSALFFGPIMLINVGTEVSQSSEE